MSTLLASRELMCQMLSFCLRRIEMADYLGQRFANYRLLRLLGKGSFADVYLGRHISLKTEAAIKIFDGRLEPDALHHFRTEVEHLRLLEHPSIMGLHEVGLEGDVPFLVMDVASGGTLRDRHPDGTMLPLATVLSYVQPIASALDYAHAHRLIHRDLKPENLLFGRDNDIVLSDFGMALLLRSTDSMSMQGIGGTLAYMAPEQIRGKPSAATDQYALSIMVYEWLAGSRPFHGGGSEICGAPLFLSPAPLHSL